MAKTSTPAQIRKGLSEAAQLITDRRLPTALSSIASDAKLFAKAKANPKAFLAKHQIKYEVPFLTALQLSRAGKKITLCIHTRYEYEGFYWVDGVRHPIKVVIENEVCTTFLIPN